MHRRGHVLLRITINISRVGIITTHVLMFALGHVAIAVTLVSVLWTVEEMAAVVKETAKIERQRTRRLSQPHPVRHSQPQLPQ